MIILFTFDSEDDKQKFEYVYERYKRLLLHKAYQILHDYALAEDAVSEAYLRIYKNIHKIEDPASNQTISFVVTILKNAALTMLEKEKKQPKETIEPFYSDNYDLEFDVLSRVTAEQIYHLMDQLQEEYRSILVLKFAHGFSSKEIAKVLNISENNVTVRLHRAKKKLGAILTQEGYSHG